MIFKHPQLTPEEYKDVFLRAIDTIAPEVAATFSEKIIPLYKQLARQMSCDQVKSIYDCITTDQPEFISEILFCYDENFRYCADENPELNEKQTEILKNLLEFRSAFNGFIEGFGLTKQWLKWHIFNTLAHFADKLHLLKRWTFAIREYSLLEFNGYTLTFNQDGWRICDIDSEDYKKQAIAAFKEHLKRYIEETSVEAKRRGYKVTKGGRSNDFDRVKWLVVWNKYDFEYLADIIQPIRDHCEVNVTVDAVRKAFTEFEKLDLPVRPYGKNRKNIGQKDAELFPI